MSDRNTERCLTVPDLLRKEDRPLEAMHEAGHALGCVLLGGTVDEMNLTVDDGGRGATGTSCAGMPSDEDLVRSRTALDEVAQHLVAAASGDSSGPGAKYLTSLYAGWVAEVVGGHVMSRPVKAVRRAHAR